MITITDRSWYGIFRTRALLIDHNSVYSQKFHCPFSLHCGAGCLEKLESSSTSPPVPPIGTNGVGSIFFLNILIIHIFIFIWVIPNWYSQFLQYLFTGIGKGKRCENLRDYLLMALFQIVQIEHDRRISEDVEGQDQKSFGIRCGFGLLYGHRSL